MTSIFTQSSSSSCMLERTRKIISVRLGSSFFGASLLCVTFAFGSVAVNAQSTEGVELAKPAYKSAQSADSEFDNASDPFALYWQDADEDYQDTIFGELMYSEPSSPTKIEMLRLISKETPSLLVFIHAMSMGLGVDDMLLASLDYEPEKARDLANSAVTLLPLVNGPDAYRYSTYNIGELTRYVDGQLEEQNKGYVDKVDEHKPYSIQEVVDKFFDQRLVLAPYPDWIDDGQFHFMASAKELLDMHSVKEDQRWYHSKTSKSVDDRPILISLYEHNKRVLVDGAERIKAALEKNEDAQLPVVFIFNRLNERSIDDLGYPASLRGMRNAYVEKSLMLTPAPQWEIGEYHSFVEIEEFDSFINLPEEEDFEPEAWEALLTEAENYDVNDTSFLVTILPATGGKIRTREHNTDAAFNIVGSNLFAASDNPRTAGKYKYTPPSSSDNIQFGLNSILGGGLIVNRPDLLSALRALGVVRVPISVFYLDGARVKPYRRGPKSLIGKALGLDTPNIIPPHGGGVLPPPVDLPPASPPGLP